MWIKKWFLWCISAGRTCRLSVTAYRCGDPRLPNDPFRGCRPARRGSWPGRNRFCRLLASSTGIALDKRSSHLPVLGVRDVVLAVATTVTGYVAGKAGLRPRALVLLAVRQPFMIRQQRTLHLLVHDESVSDTAGTPRYAVGPALDPGE